MFCTVHIKPLSNVVAYFQGPKSFGPSPIQVLTPKNLTLLENSHGSPFWFIGSVHIATGFNTEPSPFAASWGSFHLGHVDVLPRVELECRLGTVDFQVHFGVRVGEAGQELQGLGSSVQGDL